MLGTVANMKFSSLFFFLLAPEGELPRGTGVCGCWLGYLYPFGIGLVALNVARKGSLAVPEMA